MNQIIKNLEVIEQDLNNIKAERDAKIEAIRQEYSKRLDTMHKRYESYRLVAEELGLLETQQADDETASEISDESTDQEEIEIEHRHPAQKYDLTIGDAAEKVLREKGTSMPLRELQQKVAELGVTPTPSTFRSTLAKDRKNRFEAVKRGVYKLRDSNGKAIERKTDTLIDSYESPVTTNGNKAIQKKSSFVMTQAIREIVFKLNREPFNEDWLFNTLQEKYPNEINESKRKSVYATLGNLVKQRKLDKLQRGKDGNPAIFRETPNSHLVMKFSRDEDKLFTEQ